MRSRRSTKWKRSSFDWVAGNIRTGTLTSPNEMVPLQMGRGGMAASSPLGEAWKRPGLGPGRAEKGSSRFSTQRGVTALGAGFTGLEPCSGRLQAVSFAGDKPVDAVDRRRPNL